MSRNKRRTRFTLVPVLMLAGLGLVACAHGVGDVPTLSESVTNSSGDFTPWVHPFGG
jgi:hypothetical protein